MRIVKSAIFRFRSARRSLCRRTSGLRHRMVFCGRKTREFLRGPRGGERVSVVIPSFNRFDSMQRAVSSVLRGMWKNVEVIVVNDCSTDHRYNSLRDTDRVRYLHLEKNSRELFGFPCAGYVRTCGAKVARGNFLAFLDDDDEWMPWKLIRQIRLLRATNTRACCTEAFWGQGAFSRSNFYRLYNGDIFHEELVRRFAAGGMDVSRGLPAVFDGDLLAIHNAIITSSVLLERTVFVEVGGMQSLPNAEEDVDCWRRVAHVAVFSYDRTPCVFYDAEHGGGRHY